MRLSKEVTPVLSGVNYLDIDAYDFEKWNIGESIIFNNGATPEDKYFSPTFVTLRPNEQSTSFAVSAIYAHKFSKEITYLWAVENVTTASNTRRIMLWTINNKTGAQQWNGFITVTLSSSTAHTLRGFKVDIKNESTGTVEVSGTAVTGTGSSFSTNRVAIGARIGFGSTDPKQITQWYRVSAIGSDTSITLASSAGTIAAGTQYVIQEFRPVLLFINATTTNGGIHLVKGVSIEDYITGGTTIALAVSTDSQKASYWIKDASTQTNIVGVGMDIDESTDLPTTRDCYVLDLPVAGSYKVYKYNIRAALTVASGASTSAFLFATGNAAFTGTGSTAANLCIATAGHGSGNGVKSLYFVSTTRLMRAAISSIVAASTTWIVDSILEIPPGGSTGYTAPQSMTGISYIGAIDRFVIASGNGGFSYVTKFINGDPFDRMWGRNMLNIDNLSKPSGSPSAFHNAAITLNLASCIGSSKVFIAKQGTSSSNCQVYCMSFGSDDEYRDVSRSYIITPEIDLTDVNKLYRVFINALTFHGDNVFGRSSEPYYVYYRTTNIQIDHTTGWAIVPENTNLIALTTSGSIQFMITQRVIGDIMLPAFIKSVCLEYEDNTTLSNYAISVEKCDVNTKQFAWWFAMPFGGTVPNLKINLYDADTGGLLHTDTTTASANGTWEKTIDGVSWLAYDSLDRSNNTTWIRYTPISLADNIKVSAYLTLA